MEFVASSVLIGSEDGYHTTEKHINNIDNNNNNKNQTSLRQDIIQQQNNIDRSNMSLAEQLEINRQIKEQAYKDKYDITKYNKLTDDDIDWLSKQKKSSEYEQLKKEQDELLLKREFQQAKQQKHNNNNNNVNKSSNSKIDNKLVTSTTTNTPAFKLQIKRKSIDNQDNKNHATTIDSNNNDTNASVKRQAVANTDNNTTDKPHIEVTAKEVVSYAKSANPPIGLGLVNYTSDDED